MLGDLFIYSLVHQSLKSSLSPKLAWLFKITQNLRTFNVPVTIPLSQHARDVEEKLEDVHDLEFQLFPSEKH